MLKRVTSVSLDSKEILVRVYNNIDIPISKIFITDILEFNKLYCEKQMNHIKKGIQLINIADDE